MALEPIPFFTGKQFSGDAAVAITPGTDSASFSSAEQNAKNRTWAITAAANGANLPANPYRGEVTVDNSAGSATVWLVITSTANPSYTLGIESVPASGKETFLVSSGRIGKNAMSFVLDGAGGTACVISERSFV